MRLWSLHPKYLDTKGLLALWREGLLAQKVLAGNTKGYKNHPQLNRFKEHSNPLQAIANYLHAVCDDAKDREYSFDRSKILKQKRKDLSVIKVTDGQMEYEFEHLKRKLLIRDKVRYQQVMDLKRPDVHPMFKLIAGGVADWEKIS